MRTFSYIVLAFVLTWSAIPMRGKADDTISVVATGLGKDSAAALKNALRAAVEQVVGSIVDTETLVKNEEVVSDKILSFSGGFVQKYEQLGEPKAMDGGLVSVRISAEVKRNELGDGLRKAGVTKEQIDGESLFAEKISKIQSREDGIEMLKWMIEEHLLACLSVSKAAEPRFDLDKNKVVLEIRTTLEWEKYDAFVKRFAEVLIKMGVARSSGRTFTIERDIRYLYNPYEQVLMTTIQSDNTTSLHVDHSGEKLTLCIAFTRWRALTQKGQKMQVNFAVGNIPREVYDEIRNSLIVVRDKNIAIELLDGRDKTVSTTKIPPYFPFSNYTDKASILFAPILNSQRMHESPILFIKSGLWPGTPEHREEVQLDMSMDDMKKVRNIQFRFE